MKILYTLREEHKNHLLSEGFTLSEIESWVEEGLRSISEEEAYISNFKIFNKKESDDEELKGEWISGSGIYFPFTERFAQVRLDIPIVRDDGKSVKYITPLKAKSEAYIPEGCIAITEGIKDGRMGCIRGGVAVGAVAGVSHYKIALPKGCQYTIIFDSDGWTNPAVMLNLVNAGLWCNSKIQLIPELPNYPKGGICEYFKSGYTETDFKKLIGEALTPKELVIKWSSKIKNVPKDRLEMAIRYMGKFAIELEMDESDRKALISNAKEINKGTQMRTAIRNASNVGLDTEVDWDAPRSHNSTIGYWREKQGLRVWEPLCNFDFAIQSELQSDDGGGYILMIKPQFIDQEYRCILDSKALRTPFDFKDALQKQLGFQVQIALKPAEFSALLAERQYQYRVTRNGDTKKIIKTYGKQSDGTWVFKDIQISKDGKLINPVDQEWAWTDRISPTEVVPCPELAEQSGTQPIKELYETASVVFEDNLNAFYLTTGWVIATLNNDVVMNEYSSFPILNLHGDAGTSKSTAIEAAFSLVGKNWSDHGIIASSSIPAIYEYISRVSCIPFCWDDPPKNPYVDEFAKDLWNGKARIVSGKQQKPVTSVAFTSNYIIGSEQPATWTRITRVAFKQSKLSKHYSRLRSAMRNASGSFSEIVKIKHNQSIIDELQSELISRLPYANTRISQSFAIITYYAVEAMKLAGVSNESIKAFKLWVLRYVQSQENDTDSMGDSLVEFFDHINTLRSTDKVGEWNVIDAEEDGIEYYAVAHSSVWSAIKREFNPQTYDKNSIKSKVIEVGGMIDKTKRFLTSPTNNKTMAKRCWLAPKNKVDIDQIELGKF